MKEKPQRLGALIPVRLKGSEYLRHDGKELPLTILDFWQWSASDLVSNLTRGRFAEFIVAYALGIYVASGVRNEWDAYDLTTRGGIKVEVKTSAYIQSWRQTALSKIAWSLGPTREWVAAKNQWSSDVRWQADIYVLALFESEKKRTTADPLDLARWRFFVVPVRALQHHTKKILMKLQAVKVLAGDGVGYDALADAVRAIHEANRTRPAG